MSSKKFIDQEAQDLYAEHRAIVDRKNELAGQAMAKAFTRKAAGVEKLQNAGVIDEEQARRMTIGRRLSSKIVKAEAQYADNTSDSTQHYEANRDAYHQMATREAQADGVDIDFGGGVATNVDKNPPKVAATQEHLPIEAPKS